MDGPPDLEFLQLVLEAAPEVVGLGACLLPGLEVGDPLRPQRPEAVEQVAVVPRGEVEQGETDHRAIEVTRVEPRIGLPTRPDVGVDRSIPHLRLGGHELGLGLRGSQLPGPDLGLGGVELLTCTLDTRHLAVHRRLDLLDDPGHVGVLQLEQLQLCEGGRLRVANPLPLVPDVADRVAVRRGGPADRGREGDGEHDEGCRAGTSHGRDLVARERGLSARSPSRVPNPGVTHAPPPRVGVGVVPW